MTSPEPLSTQQIEQLTDDELLSRYLATSQEVGDPEVECLIPEMTKRDLEF